MTRNALASAARWLLSGTLVLFLPFAGCNDSDRGFSLQPTGSVAPNARTVPAVHQRLQSSYLYPERVPSDPTAFASVDALLASLNDPFTFEVTAQQLAGFQQGSQAGKGLEVAYLGTFVYVSGVDPGGPAWREGLRRNDLVVRMNQTAIDANTPKATLGALLAGTPLEVEVRRAGTPQTFTVANELFTTVSVEAQSIDADTHYARIGDWPLTSVDPRGPTGELEDLLAAHPTKTRWILDLRWNTGGSVLRASEVVDLFAAAGTIVAFRDRNGASFGTVAAPGHAGEGMQVVVLINGWSASSSELLAAGLRQLSGAELVGQTSFGKGVAQTIFEYAEGGALYVVTHQAEDGAGNTWNDVGLLPDVTVALDPLQLQQGVDSQLQAAISAVNAVLPPVITSGMVAAPAHTRATLAAGGDPDDEAATRARLTRMR